MENTTLTSKNLTTDKSFNGTIWRPLNSDLNDELVFEVAQKNNISINLSKNSILYFKLSEFDVIEINLSNIEINILYFFKMNRILV